ncbi:uncharacterized protein ZK1073.1-like [Oppia nitens]|uniref:uncharacterized protein ZK1073.1-like n=1 Tax=Oppia nitens TaxID=1686743 RepID=UPI0023DBEB91|nr:uncharacterized protein ZK1073.1-like [Oppia nitens]
MAESISQTETPTAVTTVGLSTVAEHEPIVLTREIESAFGIVRVHVQGELNAKSGMKAVFLTVHDIGANHCSWREFVSSDSMTEIRNRSLFLHLDVVGQHDGADDVPDDAFPTIQQMGEQVIPQVLDALDVPLVVGVGEGAGANMLARFGLAHPQRVLGLVLVHLVSSEVGFLETLKDRLFGRRNSQQMSSLDIVALHKIGRQTDDESARRLLESYGKRVQTLNARNLQKYVKTYMNRKEILDLRDLDVLLVTGARSPYCAGVEAIHAKCNKTKTSLLKVDDAVDVLSEFPEKLAQNLLLFVKGLGFLTSCPAMADRSDATTLKTLGSIGRRRTLSMEEYDIPRIRRLSLTK